VCLTPDFLSLVVVNAFDRTWMACFFLSSRLMTVRHVDDLLDVK